MELYVCSHLRLRNVHSDILSALLVYKQVAQAEKQGGCHNTQAC